MNRESAYSLRLLLLCPLLLCPLLLLLLVAAPALAQTEPPTVAGAATTAAAITTPTITPTITGTATIAAATAMPTAISTPTASPMASPTSTTTPSITPTKAPPATSLPTNTVIPPVVPLPSETTPTASPGTAEAGGGAGGPAGNNLLVPLLIGGLFLLALLAIGGLLLLRRRQPRPAAVQSARGRPTVALPPIGADTLTSVLTPVYLQLEGDAPQQFPIYQTPFAIGRDARNQLVIDETFPQWQTVSREHAIISRHERGYVIEDLGSQNGVRVNGHPTPKNLLRNGWQVSIGGVNFRFVDETQAN